MIPACVSQRIRYKGIVCDRCGVEVTERKVRRERMGHIQLVVPVAHIWFFKKIAALIGIPANSIVKIIYYENFIVIQPGAAEGIKLGEKDKVGVQRLTFLTEDQSFDVLDKIPAENKLLDDSDPNKFIAKMGAEALYDMLATIDLDKEAAELREKAAVEHSQQRKQDILKRLQVFESFRDSANAPRTSRSG